MGDIEITPMVDKKFGAIATGLDLKNLGDEEFGPVSYTHLTLPTIYSV